MQMTTWKITDPPGKVTTTSDLSRRDLHPQSPASSTGVLLLNYWLKVIIKYLDKSINSHFIKRCLGKKRLPVIHIMTKCLHHISKIYFTIS